MWMAELVVHLSIQLEVNLPDYQPIRAMERCFTTSIQLSITTTSIDILLQLLNLSHELLNAWKLKIMLILQCTIVTYGVKTYVWDHNDGDNYTVIVYKCYAIMIVNCFFKSCIFLMLLSSTKLGCLWQ